MLFLRKLAVAIGLACVFPLAVYYGVRAIEPPPDAAAYHIAPMPDRSALLQGCSDADTGAACRTARLEFQQAQEAYRERQAEAADRLAEAEARFAERLFTVATPIGLVGIILGGLLTQATVGTGLILGGLSSIVLGYAGYWTLMDDLWRFLALVAALVVLLWLGWRKLTPPGDSGNGDPGDGKPNPVG